MKGNDDSVVHSLSTPDQISQNFHKVLEEFKSQNYGQKDLLIATIEDNSKL